MSCIWARLYRLRKNILNEGHGFSRAAHSMSPERALAPEVLLSRSAETFPRPLRLAGANRTWSSYAVSSSTIKVNTIFSIGCAWREAT
jgi:hypothetical protein